ncbi:Beta-barrel assembly-enhancing protease [Nymphon striatum]|nr:Beta-barrel assembly-enhancing protease [Nymphon striatum]
MFNAVALTNKLIVLKKALIMSAFFIVVLLVSSSSYAGACSPNKLPSNFEAVKVKWVYDGDTLLLEDKRKIRIIGIDTPEVKHHKQLAEAYGQKAREALRELLKKHDYRVLLKYGKERKDRYKRILAHVFLPNKTNISVWLLENGFAKTLPIPPNLGLADCYKQAERVAQRQGLKIWRFKSNIIQPISELSKRHKGYVRLKGKVRSVKSGKVTVIKFADSDIQVKITSSNLPYFEKISLDQLEGRQELSMGAQAHKSILKQKKPYNNAALQSYVNGIGQMLAKQSHRNKIKFTFTVLDDPSVNAFALPGGYVYITTGIMAYLNSEGELAGVLGHEIGHVTARHGVKQQSAGVASAILVDLLSKKTGASSSKSFGQLGTALLRGYGRDHELQSDKLGAEYLARVGYDPENMIDVVSVLKAQEEFDKYQAKKEGRAPRAYHGVFATHPKNDLRLQEVIKSAKRFKSAGTRNANHDGYLRRINGLKYRIDKNKTGRIVVGKTTTKGLTFASLAKRSKVDEQRLRLLNGKFPSGQPEYGKLVKIIQ